MLDRIAVQIEAWLLALVAEAVEWLLMVRGIRFRIEEALDELEARTVDISADLFARRAYPHEVN
jgi:hypothetical protein